MRIDLNPPATNTAIPRTAKLNAIPLNFLSAGESAAVESISAVSAEMHRLNEMGLRSGAVVEMVRPGAPCIIRVGGVKVCLRSDELAHVLVVPGAR